METRTCHICGTVVGKHDACPTCVANWPQRKPAQDMTIEEKTHELDLLSGVLEVPFQLAHERIEEIMGRPVWTHELANFNQLKHELLTGHKASMEDILDKFPSVANVIVVEH